MIPLSSDTIEAVKRQLEGRGYVYKFKETYGGDGFTLIARRPRSADIEARSVSPDVFREACLSVLRDDPKHTCMSGDFRILAQRVAARLNVSNRVIGRLIHRAGLTTTIIGGRIWIVRDVKWAQVFEQRRPIRTPVT